MKDSEDKNAQKAKSKSEKNSKKKEGLLRKLFGPVVWLNLLGMALVAFLLFEGLKYFLNQYTCHGQEIEVPDVTGKKISEAVALLNTLGIESEIADSSYKEGARPGTVLEQRPKRGGHVKPGRIVALTVMSAHAPTMVMPDILGNSSTREAEARLQSLGFKIGERQYIPGDKDWVYGMFVNGKPVFNGDKVDIGSTIVLQVGSGESEGPRLEGDSIQDPSINEILKDLYGDFEEEGGIQEDFYDYE